MKYSLAIFDMDGTVLNTISDIAGAVNYILNKYEYTTYTEDEVLQFVGQGLKFTLSHALSSQNATIKENKFDTMYADFITYYAKHSNDKTTPYTGIIDVLKKLKNQGVQLALVSNKRHEQVQELCNIYFPNLFEIAYGESKELGISKKPNPDSIHAILKKLAIPAKKTVYIGDSEIDIQTAKNANIDCIAVGWGFRSKKFQKEHGAKIFATIPEDILTIIES
ncbi:MAG TPA: HAD family hydrolase [Treponemataceae bacterium]|nr:HAD family hydrolase [Treponemataceae bacterium]